MPDFSHTSGRPNAFDRHALKNFTRLVFEESVPGDGRFLQAAEFNELQSIVEARGARVGNLVARDGDRYDGADALVDTQAGTVTLTAGEIYIAGDVLPVEAAVLNAVPMAGEVRIGVRLTVTTVTAEEDPDLYGLAAGTLGELEPGASRQRDTIAWGFEGDGGTGKLYPVYLLKDGTVIDQSPPPSLTGINRAIGRYDFGANGSYIVSGCRAAALGKSGADQIFVISEGEFNVAGNKYERGTSLRHLQEETFDTEAVDAEPHSFADAGSGTATITLNRSPVDQVTTVTVTKRITETITRGPASDTSDALAQASVAEIESVVQGGTTYVAGVDFQRSGSNVDWSLGGAEPAGGSSYDVTYLYLDNVAPDSQTATSVTVSGGVTDEPVFVSYTWKLNRTDLLCLNPDGLVTYLEGISTRGTPLPPIPPANVLPVALVENTWTGAPKLTGSNQRSIPYRELWRNINRIYDTLDLLLLTQTEHEIDLIEDVGKYGTLWDDFQNDLKRDDGEVQTLSSVNGSLQLAVDPIFFPPLLDTALTLPFTEEVIIDQPLVTGCTLINPYANFDPLPAEMTIDPPTDFWTERQLQWTSGATVQFAGQDTTRRPARTQLVEQRDEELEFLREISVAFFIEGFGAGEILTELLFDGLDVTPDPQLIADGNGDVTGTFDIPANVPAGRKLVEATGAGGSTASTSFEGQGRLEIDVIRRVPPPPPPPVERGGGGGDAGGGADPQAQSFTIPATMREGRMITSTEVKFCARGDNANAVEVDLVDTGDEGEPTRSVFARARIAMDTVVLDDWHQTGFGVPLYRRAGQEQAVVYKTDDAAHGLSIANVGDFDAATQSFVAAQPYSVGVRFSSSNNRAWTPHQTSDLAFRINAASFTQTTLTQVLGTVDLVNVSDIMIRAAMELPTADCSILFEVVRADNSVIRLTESQNHEFDEFVTETVTIRAVLGGTEHVSPILYPNVMVIAGRLQTNGVYITRAHDFGQNVDLVARLRNKLPTGSTMTVEWDNADDNFAALTLDNSTQLNDGFVQRDYSVAGITAQTGRLKIGLTGSPAARPSAAKLRVYSRPGA